jgi:2-polyprenyl-6-methoxyphenol hydroxylase-like FAD-dependent oxidoreductase
MNPQILIVGAGPVGLTMAAELARYGIPLRIVEKSTQRSDKSKALVLWSRTLEHLDRAGCGPAFVQAGHKVTAAAITADHKPVGRISLTNVDTPHAYALMLPQSDTERLLEQHLNSLGVTVERDIELTAFSQTATAVTATLRHANGTEEHATAAWLIGCDGAHSTIRHALGLAFEGDTLPTDWMLADVHIANLPTPPDELTLYWHEEGLLALFPMSPTRFRVVANGGDGTGAHPADPTLGQVQAVLDRRGPQGATLSDPVWLSAFRINERKVQEYRSGRIFLAGDAAHVHSPAGGQGMNTGMQDAINLAWKLALVCQGLCADALLDSYSQERSPVGAQVIAQSGQLTTVGTIRNHPLQHLRNFAARIALGLSPVRNAVAEGLTEIAIGYPHSALNGPADRGLTGPAPRERVPPRTTHPQTGAGHPRFRLHAEHSAAATSLCADFPSLLDPALQPPLAPGGAWLVRPDGYVACATTQTGISRIDAYLRTLCPAA